MNRILFPALLALFLSGCRITTTIVGEGRVTSQNGHFNCATGNTGDCAEDYQTGGAETLVAVPAPGWAFVNWTNCNYVSIRSCTTSFGQNTAGDVWPIVATFKPIDPPVQAATYTYNALGQRMTKTVGNVTTLFQYDLAGNLITEQSGSGQVLRQHIHVGNVPIAQLTRKSGGAFDVQYVHTDYLGTPTLLTDQNGKVVADIETMPFGESYVDYAVVEYNKRFPGQYKDAESGLNYNYFRDYDPNIGRYTQSDLIGLNGGLNLYGYAYQNPLLYFDLYGLEVEVKSRGVNGTGNAAAHTFTTVTQANGNVTTISSRNDNGLNVVSLNHPSDVGANTTDSIEIAIPEGMTESQFDQAVLDEAKELMSELPQSYDPFPDIYKDFPNNPTEGNCHTTTTKLINGAGGKIPKGYNPRGLNPGLNYYGGN